MDNYEKRELNLQTKLALLERDIDDISDVFSKLDYTVTKLAEVAEHLNKLVALHEERIERVHTEMAQIREEIGSLKQSMKGYDRLKWILVGAATVIGYLIAGLGMDVLQKF